MVFLYEGRQISYSVRGSGTPLVLLHGYLESSEIWESFAEKLSAACTVVSVDLPGHGHSDVFGSVHTMEFIASVIKELLDSLKIQKALICGHSLGGYVALAILELYPEYLSGYCLFHSHPFADPPEAVEKRLREIAIVKAGKKELMYPDNVTRMFAPSNLEKFQSALQRSKVIASKIPGEGIIAVLNGMIVRPSRSAFMEEGKVPCLWILGLMDNYIPCEAIQSRVYLPLNAKVVVLKNSGHIGFIEEEDLSIRTVKDFVNSISNFCPPTPLKGG
jgi:pimeloyl-ACP methyl ester carboxylesterase